MLPVSSFMSKMEFIDPYQIPMGNNMSLEEKERVTVDLLIKVGSTTKRCTLKNVVFVPLTSTF